MLKRSIILLVLLAVMALLLSSCERSSNNPYKTVVPGYTPKSPMNKPSKGTVWPHAMLPKAMAESRQLT